MQALSDSSRGGVSVESESKVLLRLKAEATKGLYTFGSLQRARACEMCMGGFAALTDCPRTSHLQASLKTSKQQKREAYFPQRKFAVKA
jgi:hypothetical protein